MHSICWPMCASAARHPRCDLENTPNSPFAIFQERGRQQFGAALTTAEARLRQAQSPLSFLQKTRKITRSEDELAHLGSDHLREDLHTSLCLRPLKTLLLLVMHGIAPAPLQPTQTLSREPLTVTTAI